MSVKLTVQVIDTSLINKSPQQQPNATWKTSSIMRPIILTESGCLQHRCIRRILLITKQKHTNNPSPFSTIPYKESYLQHKYIKRILLLATQLQTRNLVCNTIAYKEYCLQHRYTRRIPLLAILTIRIYIRKCLFAARVYTSR